MARKYFNLTAQITGANASFSITPGKFYPGSVQLVLNGVDQTPVTHYSEGADQQTINTTFTPLITDTLVGWYDDFALSPAPSTPSGQFAGDSADLIGVWATGQAVHQIVRRTNTNSDSGAQSPSWANLETQLMSIQSYRRKDRVSSGTQGIDVSTIFFAIVSPTSGVLQLDRIRPPLWVAGQDEYQVTDVEDNGPSHLLLWLEKTKGHAS